jgi:hypothetical protein
MRSENLTQVRLAVIGRIGIAAVGVLIGTLVLSLMRGWRGPVCLIWLVYHIHCPGCGLTRSLVEIWRGHPGLSLRYHPLGIPLFILCILAVLAAILHWRLEISRPVIQRIAERVLSHQFLSPVACLVVLLWLTRLVLEYRHCPLFLW